MNRNILLLIPHPDDEVVGMCAAIGRAQAKNACIFGLYLTHGCLARETMWPWERQTYERAVGRRRAEAEKVAAFLAITPVGWSARPARHLWQDMRQVHAEISAAILRHAIDEIWVPAYEGGNPDHDALNAVAFSFRSQVLVTEFAEYNFHQHRTNAQAFPFPHEQETVITLTAEEQDRKREAMKLYESERCNLNYVGMTHECHRPLADYDYAAPPHLGTLWYTRFQWVPFRHPRVDFTKPADVSAAIKAFLSKA